jgi:L-Ala-D/L-Glu epimerase
MQIDTLTERHPFKSPFAISGYVFSSADVIFVSVSQDGVVGCGEAYGVYYDGENPALMRKQILDFAARAPSNFTRTFLQSNMPPGGARNALDCALWDLEAKLTGVSVWQRAGLPEPKPIRTTMTIGVDTPGQMARDAEALAGALSIKVKLAGDGLDADRLVAIRRARPDVWMGVDANQGLNPSTLAVLMPTLMSTNVSLIEQPFKREADALIDSVHSPIFLAADESVKSLADIDALGHRYDVINIKLDKCGGLTEGLEMVKRARAMRLRTMVGCMPGTVTAMAPAWLLAQICDYADIDGPLSLQNDREQAAEYSGGFVSCPPAAWGNPL